MASLIGIVEQKDILLVQAYLLLKQKGVKIDRVYAFRSNAEPDLHTLGFFSDKELPYNVIELFNGGTLYSQETYQKLEKEIMQVYYDICKQDEERYVFVGGGHKFCVLAMQKCATIFGSHDLFHTLYNGLRGTEPKTVSDIVTAIKEGKLLYISLGREPGWPAINMISHDGQDLWERVNEIAQKITSVEINTINEYPFESIALLPPKAIQWLEGQLDESDENWLKTLPKTELHCHLGGFAVQGNELEIVRSAAEGLLPPIERIDFPSDWPVPTENVDLKKYMALGNNGGSKILSDRGSLKKQIACLYDYFLKENIKYAEVRCSPQNYASNQYAGNDILQIIKDEFTYHMIQNSSDGQPMCHVNILVIGTRTESKNKDLIKRHVELVLQYAKESDGIAECCVVGIDLAGFEHKTTRAKYYESDFTPVHRKGIALTIHAGENDDAEGIWQAIFKLNTRRIGHGLNLFQSPELIRSVINRQIGVEMCPYANYQIVGFQPMKEKRIYPLLDYLNAGVQVTINTDNIGISGAGLSDNFLFLTKMAPDITRMQVLQLIRNGIEQAFVTFNHKRKLVKLFNQSIFDIMYKNLIVASENHESIY